MSGMTAEQLHRTTLGIYSTLMDEFNPSLQRLVSLGNSYIQAFQALAATSEAYFGALSRIGEKAYHTVSSRSIGDVLIQISETQRRITLEMEGVFRFFSVEVIREMDNNVRLDKGYLSESRKRYEMEVLNQAAARERQLWRSQDGGGDYMKFLRASHEEALKEEERRHRFVTEKHCSLIQSVAEIMNKAGDSLKQRSDGWRNDVNATRGQETRRPAPLDNYASTGMGKSRDDNIRRSKEEPALGNIPSRAPSPVGGGRPAGGRTMRARVAHQPASSNRTQLPFSRGETITLLVQQARNGWLYGRAERSPNPGWFPASYVEAVDDLPVMTITRPTLRSSSSSSQLDQLGSRSLGGAPNPPPPPPPPLSLGGPPEMQPAAPPPAARAETKSENKKSKPHSSQPELFPRGTNPFATVKLRPTSTNDRSAPHF
ncbi:BAR/IMD domain-containing adapter protein 2-like 2 [Nelusetta ayraudi]|uniref:BAR/IMD domain-containing adapter protein 2-like 2 n=1 Tax=Nelusetta ayraudi TaxID=303726 RepID=UPI003F6FC434